jgi:hypothetical protein
LIFFSMCTSLSAIRSHSVQHPAIDVLGMKHLQSAISSFFFEMGIPQPLHQLMHTASFIKKIVITTRIQYAVHTTLVILLVHTTSWTNTIQHRVTPTSRNKYYSLYEHRMISYSDKQSCDRHMRPIASTNAPTLSIKSQLNNLHISPKNQQAESLSWFAHSSGRS